jgi:hypothetical protein
MYISISALLALVFALFLLSAARLPGRISQVLGGWLLVAGQIILALLVLNSFERLDNRTALLGVQGLLTLLAGLVWRRAGRPSLLIVRLTREDLDLWRKTLRAFPQLAFLGLLSILAYCFSVFLIWAVIPNTHDSMTVHLSRVAYWLQHGSFFPWQAFDMRPVIYPVNASLLTFWTVLLHGSDQLAGLVQWTSALVLIACAFGIARLLGYSRAQSAFAALIFGFFPLILMQSSSTQIDLTAAALFVPAVFFLLLGMHNGRSLPFVFSGLALGLAVGAKQTVLFFLPGLALFALLQLSFWRSHTAQLKAWLAACAGFTLLLGVYMYGVNLLNFGNPFGPRDLVAYATGPMSGNSVAMRMLYNLPRLGYDAIDFSGLPSEAENGMLQAKANLARALLGSLRLDLEAPVALMPNHEFSYELGSNFSEDQAWYGPLSIILLFPALAWALYAAVRGRDLLRMGLILWAFSALLMDVLLRPGYDEFQGRYLIGAAAMTAPFMGVWVKETRASRIMLWAVSLLAAVMAYHTMLYNPAKPVISDRVDILTTTRVQEYTLTAGEYNDFLQLVRRNVPQDATIAFYSPSYIWDYVLFGPYLTRTVIPILDQSLLVNDSWLEEQGIDYLLVNLSAADRPAVSNTFAAVQQGPGEWRLYARK